MHRIRAGLDNRQVKLDGEPGETRISLAVLISLAFWAASAAPGVRQVFRARPSGRELSGNGRARSKRDRLVSSADLRIELELSIVYGFNALVVAEEVRQAVLDEVADMTGLQLAGVELTIADVD